jgi:hypothetical protein
MQGDMTKEGAMTLYKFLKRLRLLIDHDHEYLNLWKTRVYQPAPYNKIFVYLDNPDGSVTRYRITIEEV